MAFLAGLVLLVLGLLPIANWMPGGHEAPWFADRVRLWTSGGAIVVGLAFIAGLGVRRRPELWRDGLWARYAARWRAADRVGDAAVAAVAFALYAVVAQWVFSAKPLLIDEIIQLYQARIFAGGRLWAPAAAHPEFTSSMHLLDWGGKAFGQFPAGGPAMLTLGVLVGAAWLVGPLFGALGVFCFGRLLRRIEARDGVAFAALLLFAFAPFSVFLDGSMMNHVPETTWLLAAALGLAAATATDQGAPRAAFGMGLALGIAATIRPLDGAAFALPAAAWLLLRARAGGRHVTALLASGVGVALPLAALLAINASQTGHATQFGYIAMWGRSHELGFHEAPWGFAHTPARGLELVNLYLLRLQTYFLETPVPALLFATGALLLVRRLSAFDRWALWGCALLLAAYFAYWHDGFYLGPRFVLPLAPWLALWTARFPSQLEERGAPAPLRHGMVVGGVVALAMGATMLVPLRAEQYRNGMLSMRTDVEGLARSAGVSNAVVLVRESWGAQLVVRMWALGVSRTDAERIYRTADACKLDQALAATERSGGDRAAFERLVTPLRADSSKLVGLRVSPDTTPRITPGSTLAPRCLQRIVEDRSGFTVFAPLLLAGGDGNVYVRDLHARDTLLLAAHPEKPVYLFTKDTLAASVPRFVKVSLDSARASWRDVDQAVP